MNKEMKEIGKWWVYLTGLVVVLLIAVNGVRIMGIWGTTAMENVVFQSSYQKQNADKKANNVFSAQLAQINSKLMEDLDSVTRSDLESQKAMLEVQIQAIK